MAQIELRHAKIRVIDGYSNTALINDSPVNGDTVIEIDGLDEAGEIPIGTRFTFEGDTLTHYVSAQNSNERQLVTVNATSGNFTLSFTGSVANTIGAEVTANIAEGATAGAVQTALEGLAAIVPGDVLVSGSAGGPWTVEFRGAYAGMNMNQMTAADVDLEGGGDTAAVTTVSAGGSTWQITFTPSIATASGVPANDGDVIFAGRTLEATLGEGNLTYTENRELEYLLDRGNLNKVRQGDEQPLDVSLDFIWEFITAVSDAEVPTFEDAIKQRGVAAGWESSSSDPCEPYAVDIEIEYIPPCGGAEREIITLSDFRWESLEHNMQDASIAMAGRCNVTEATVVRAE